MYCVGLAGDKSAATLAIERSDELRGLNSVVRVENFCIAKSVSAILL